MNEIELFVRWVQLISPSMLENLHPSSLRLPPQWLVIPLICRRETWYSEMEPYRQQNDC